MVADLSTSAKTALVTGASSGIGYELTQLLAQDGYNLVLVARSELKLHQMAADLTQKYGVAVKVIPTDLSHAAAPDEIFAELQQAGITLEVLVNNAGYASYGFFADLDLTTELNMLQVNIVALTHLTKLFLPGMLARGQGKILNVASTAAFQPGPLMAVYYATKAYVLHFSEAIANELAGTGVTVTTLCPGPTESGFQATAKMEDSKLVKSQPIMDAKTVAQIGYRGLLENKGVVIPGLKNQLLTLAPRLLPRKLTTRIVRNAQDRAH